MPRVRIVMQSNVTFFNASIRDCIDPFLECWSCIVSVKPVRSVDTPNDHVIIELILSYLQNSVVVAPKRWTKYCHVSLEHGIDQIRVSSQLAPDFVVTYSSQVWMRPSVTSYLMSLKNCKYLLLFYMVVALIKKR